MLSRKLERTHTITNSPNPACQSWGRYLGNTAGTWLSSKWRDNSAKPVSKQKRFARMTHSCPTCEMNPITPVPVLKPVNTILYSTTVPNPANATRIV
jgi:hypothetical protein